MHCQKHLFSLPEGHHYLNCAYFSPLLKSVEEAGIEGMRKKRTPWQTPSKAFFEDSSLLRERFARLIGANKQRIAIMPATSYGLSTIARNLPANTGKKIIVAGEQFPSNVYPWMRFCKENGSTLQTVAAPEDAEGRGKAWNERLLDAIDSNTLMVAMANIHWADGTLFDLESIGRRAREVGAYFVIDGTQSIGALPFDQQTIQADAVICSGYKWLMGPYTMALGYFGPRFDGGVPLEEGWLKRRDSEDFSGLVHYKDEYQPGAMRYDMGQNSNFIGVPMMIAALDQLLEWGTENIQQYCRELTKPLLEPLTSLGCQIEVPQWRSHHLFGIRMPQQVDTKGLAQKLADNNIYVSVRGTAIRISPNVYNNEADIQALSDIIHQAI